MTTNNILTINGKELKSGKYNVKTLLVNGNSKIGKNVYHFSTLPGTQEVELDGFGIVKGTCFCNCKGGYCLTGNYRFSSTKAYLALRTIAARNTEFFRDQIIAEIKAKKIEYVRIHATGEFFSRDYAEAWLAIIKECKTTVFWTYTKAYGHGFDDVLNEINKQPNANIVESIIPGCGMNYGHIDYLIDTYNKLQAAGETPYICRCGIDPNQHCTNCKGCSNHKYVLFIEHSTEYKAASDPQYIDIKQLIESQPKQD